MASESTRRRRRRNGDAEPLDRDERVTLPPDLEPDERKFAKFVRSVLTVPRDDQATRDDAEGSDADSR